MLGIQFQQISQKLTACKNKTLQTPKGNKWKRNLQNDYVTKSIYQTCVLKYFANNDATLHTKFRTLSLFGLALIQIMYNREMNRKTEAQLALFK